MKPLLPLSVPVICVLLLFACNKPSQSQKFQMPTPEVTVINVQAQPVPLSRELVGRLASVRIAQVRARVAGIILKRVYTEGTDVKKGQVLFQIDPAPLKAALHAEEAALARAEADAANAKLTANRYQDLGKRGLISSQDLDTALANERTALAAVKQAQANVEKARLDLSYATVTAPIDGRAGRALVTEGALVGQGETTELTTVEQIDPIFVNFS
ncbi:MAG: efflux RND transporter periplasmic adaptor subunit, partial [Gammaproteobacteria bacterium]